MPVLASPLPASVFFSFPGKGKAVGCFAPSLFCFCDHSLYYGSGYLWRIVPFVELYKKKGAALYWMIPSSHAEPLNSHPSNCKLKSWSSLAYCRVQWCLTWLLTMGTLWKGWATSDILFWIAFLKAEAGYCEKGSESSLLRWPSDSSSVRCGPYWQCVLLLLGNRTLFRMVTLLSKSDNNSFCYYSLVTSKKHVEMTTPLLTVNTKALG